MRNQNKENAHTNKSQHLESAHVDQSEKKKTSPKLTAAPHKFMCNKESK